MSRRFYRAVGPARKTRVNHEIRISPIRLINADNEQVGIVETHDARRMAEEAGLDLVEIQADARPPLCKIMDYGKYRYELSKKKESANRSPEMKEVRLGRSMKIDEHDVAIRINQARRFLMDGHKVQLVQRFRGREMAHREIGVDRLRDLAEQLGDIAKIESPPKQAHRQISMLLAPDRQRIETIKRKLEADRTAAEREAEENARLDAELAALDAAEPDEDETPDADAAAAATESTPAKAKAKSKGKGGGRSRQRPAEGDGELDDLDDVVPGVEMPADLR